MRIFSSCALFLILALRTAAAPDGKAAEVLLLGTFHFANPGLDFVKGDVPDVLTEERQREIAAVVERLKQSSRTRSSASGPPIAKGS